MCNQKLPMDFMASGKFCVTSINSVRGNNTTLT